MSLRSAKPPRARRTAVLAGLAATVGSLGCAAVPPATQTAAPGGVALEDGIRSFRDGQTQQALGHFLDARRQGLNSPVLRYDLALTYFKLGRDAEAAEQFSSLLSDPKFADLARYNLGRIARRARRDRTAQEFLSEVEAHAADPQLRDLARAQLSLQGAGSHRWGGLVRAGGGYNDNVSLTSQDSLLTAANAASAMYFAGASLNGRLTGGARDGLGWRGSVYTDRYPSLSAFDLLVARAGLDYRLPAGDWGLRAGITGSTVTLGGAELESLGALSLGGARQFGRDTLSIGYRLERIGGGARYRYLSGWRQQFAVHAGWRLDPVTLGLGYTLTLNSRRDLQSGVRFFSASPLRQQLDFEVRWPVTLRSTVYARADYWWSVYRDPNVFLEAGILQQRVRRDQWLAAEVGLSYRLSSSLQLTAQYTLHHNASNISRYSYDSNRYTLAAEYSF
ncbi:MAG: hypothetical protein JSR67_06045 [Proteobacteria bacterium]|nr:hypothetical protein [Pseudomonadota bacterium]